MPPGKSAYLPSKQEAINLVKSAAVTVEEYLDELASPRREAVAALRQVILDHLPEGYEEAMEFGMIGYVVPLKTYPDTYNKRPLMYAALASQKNYMSLYLMNVYGDRETEAWFTERFKASGKKLDMGKSCVHFKSLDDLPLELIGDAIARTSDAGFIERYEASRRLPRSVKTPGGSRRSRPAKGTKKGSQGV